MKAHSQNLLIVPLIDRTKTQANLSSVFSFQFYLAFACGVCTTTKIILTIKRNIK